MAWIHRGRKDGAAVHFTTVPCEQSIRRKESQICTIFFPVLKTLSSLRYEDLMTFLYVIKNVLKVLCAANYGSINQPPSFFISTEDSNCSSFHHLISSHLACVAGRREGEKGSKRSRVNWEERRREGTLRVVHTLLCHLAYEHIFELRGKKIVTKTCVDHGRPIF